MQTKMSDNLVLEASLLFDSLGDTEQSYNYGFTMFRAIQTNGTPIYLVYYELDLFFSQAGLNG